MTEFNNIIKQFDKITTKHNLLSDNTIFSDINNIINKINLLNNKFITIDPILDESIDQLINRLNSQNYMIDSTIDKIIMNLSKESIDSKKKAINKIENILVNNIFNKNIVYKLNELIKLYQK